MLLENLPVVGRRYLVGLKQCAAISLMDKVTLLADFSNSITYMTMLIGQESNYYSTFSTLLFYLTATIICLS
jgi:hypothetical protein